MHSSFWVPEHSTLSKTTVWDLWGKYDVNTISFTDAADVVSWNPGPSTTIPTRIQLALVGPYEQVQRLQADHGIIEPSDRIRHDDSSERQLGRYMAPSTYIDPGR